MSKDSKWIKLDDYRIQHVWVKAQDDDCDEEMENAVVDPGWYQYNGTPICCCGADMVYSHTNICVPTKIVLDF